MSLPIHPPPWQDSTYFRTTRLKIADGVSGVAVSNPQQHPKHREPVLYRRIPGEEDPMVSAVERVEAAAPHAPLLLHLVFQPTRLAVQPPLELVAAGPAASTFQHRWGRSEGVATLEEAREAAVAAVVDDDDGHGVAGAREKDHCYSLLAKAPPFGQLVEDPRLLPWHFPKRVL